MENITFICRFCGSERKNGNSLRNHERLCKENPNRQQSALMKYNVLRLNKGHKGHNQFTKAKELGISLESKCKGRLGTFTGKHHSEETKKKISETQKKNVANGRMFGYKLNHSSKVSFPEKKVYIEIDGEQHYNDPKIIEHDKERTEKLNSLGWKCLKRVRWSSFQKFSQEEKENYCKNLINELQNYTSP